MGLLNEGKKTFDKAQVFTICAFLGVVAFLIIFGWRVIIPTYDDWILASKSDADNIQHYMGWVSYRESDWHFPVGLIENVLYPDMISIFYTDSIPLFAIPFKILSPILPETFQYLGIYGLLSLALAGGFSGLIIYSFTEKKIPSAIGSLFFSFSMVLLLRVFYHTALSGQWLILACLYTWLVARKSEGMIRIKKAVLWSLFSVLALLIQAYFLPPVWGIMACSMLSDLLESEKEEIKNALIDILITGFSAAVATVIVGYAGGLFYGGVAASGDFFGFFAFDLTSFFNSMGDGGGSAVPFAKIIPPLPFFIWSYEGYSYLGAGILILFVAIVFYGIYKLAKKEYEISFTKEGFIAALPYICFFAGFLIASTSGVIRVCGHDYVIHLPQKVVELWSVFRSSGRLIWPVYYFVMLWIIITAIKIAGDIDEKWAIALVAAILLIQLYDESGYLISLHEKFAPKVTYTSSIKDEAWEDLAKEYKHIMVYPNTNVVYSSYQGQELQYFANRHSMTMNIIYFARNVSAPVNESVYHHFEELASGEKFDDTMYVFYDEIPEDVYENYGLYMYKIDGYTIATPEKIEGKKTIQ